MNDDLYDIEGGEPTATQRRAADAVRGLATPEASADFRRALRERFVEGSFPEDEASDRTVRRAATARPRRPIRTWAVPLVVAASAAVLVLLLNRTPSWTIVETGGDHVLVDGQSMSCDELSRLQAALHPGCRIQVPDGGRLEVVTESLALQINGGIDMTLPATPGRWFSRDIASAVGGDGTLRIATNETFRGATYRIDTGPTELLVTGTAFSVMSTDEVVCVCVLEGGIAATLPDGSAHAIPSGGRFTIQRSSGEFEVGAMHDAERGALRALKTLVTSHE